MAERRGTLRAVVRIQVFDKNKTLERVPLYVTGNVSAGGMFLITQEPYPVGTELKISFSLPGDPKPIETEGTVVWSRGARETSNRQPGMGVQFERTGREDQERIREFVFNLLKEEQPVESD